MRKVIKLDGEICANCAAKIQSKIEKLDGVHSASVNAMMLKFTLDADDDKFDDILQQSIKIFDDIEPDCEVLA
ncbi:heavy-metal-associated domain-containing protein [Hugonella massiliensis]|uniref:heavy-metal-associated domain-containing protein n=1 Tax=Hugonella massiliensis TaxID=1720315 RepID=UPI00073F50D1|nr:heavy metal-associated domain-containing protein [Hugonella massiliensis]